VEPFRLANGNPHYELGQIYESIRVQLYAIRSLPFLNQQDLPDFIAPPEEYIPERQANLTVEEIAAAYSAPSDPPDNTNPQNSSDPLDGSEPRPLITRTKANHSLEVLQLYVIQTTPSIVALLETSASVESITTKWETSTRNASSNHTSRSRLGQIKVGGKGSGYHEFSRGVMYLVQYQLCYCKQLLGKRVAL